MQTIDELQQQFTEILKDFLRREVSKDKYNGKLEVVVVTTNSITGKINIDTCNVNLIGDTKKMLREGLDQLNRAQIITALASIIPKGGKKT